MYLDDFSIKEVNTYYARRGGIRTANVKGYANVGSFSGLMQRAAAQAGRAAQTATDVAAAERDSQATGTRADPFRPVRCRHCTSGHQFIFGQANRCGGRARQRLRRIRRTGCLRLRQHLL